MTIEIDVLNVGNADCIVVLPTPTSALVIDVPVPKRVTAWLRSGDRAVVECIYLTHAHRDHAPRLTTLVDFVRAWIKNGQVKRICLPDELLRPDLDRIVDPRQKDYIKRAIEQMRLWDRGIGVDGVRIEFVPGVREAGPHHYGDTVITMLHPTYIWRMYHAEEKPKELNEASLVLRLDHGDFRALFLADIEGEGLSALLDMCSGEHLGELRCHIMKVPHHGAWNGQNDALRQLLDRADPELAIVSVGSTNKHGHVVPQLFRELLLRKFDASKRLRTFICTEATRTCALPMSERTGRVGLAGRLPCAGDIVITAEPSGSWEQGGVAAHISRIQTLQYAACTDRAQLSETT